MVHVVVAGGAGNVGREVVEELVAQGKHKVTVFSRKGSSKSLDTGIGVVRVDYHDKLELTKALRGVHIVLSFVSFDPDNIAQKTLIDACIAAGVKRFAPSEWGTISNSGAPMYAFKDQVHDYLREVNADKNVLEYCLFQPGLFLNYIVYPYRTAKYLYISCVGFDLETGNAVMTEDGAQDHVWTTIQDTTRVVARAIDYEGTWPEYGGIAGTRIKHRDLIPLLEKYAGKSLKVHTLKKADLEKGEWNVSWIPPFDHPNMPAEYKTPEIFRTIQSSFELAASEGAANVSDTWNRLLPNYKFTNLETFLAESLKR